MIPLLTDFRERHIRQFDVWFLLVLAFLVIFPGLGQTKYCASHEILHAEIIREMAETGDYVETKVLGEPLVDKPPVMHAPAAVLTRLTGQPSMTLARLPSAIAALLGVLATYGIGLVLLDRKSALIGAIALLGVPGFSILARQARPDMILCTAILLSCLCLCLGMTRPQRGRRTLYFALAGAAAGVGVLTKGPYGVLFPMLFAVLAPIRRPDMKRPRLGWLAFGLALLVAASVWVIPVYLRDHGAYLHKVIFQPDLDLTHPEKKKSFLMYFGVGFAFSLPLSLFLPLAIADWRRRYSAPLAVAVMILAVITLVPKKRDHYLLPLYPFLAIGIAGSLARRWNENPTVRKLAWVLIPSSVAAFPLSFAVIQPLAIHTEDPEIRFAKEIRSAIEPSARVYSLGGHEEVLAWVMRRSDGILKLPKDDAEIGRILEQAPEVSYLVIRKRRLASLLETTGPLQLEQVLEQTVKREKLTLLRLTNRKQTEDESFQTLPLKTSMDRKSLASFD